MLIGLIHLLHALGIFSLIDVAHTNGSSNRNQSWISAEDLGLDGLYVDKWGPFLRKLVHGAIKMPKEEEKLCWSKNSSSGDSIAKLGYVAKAEEDFSGDKS